MPNPTVTAYVISKQGNRNLVLSSDDLEFFDDLTNADTSAFASAKRTGRPWFVHELTVKAVRSHRPTMTIKSQDI